MNHPIPSEHWQRIQEFADAKRTGQVTLNFNRGEIQSCDIREHVRTKKSLDKLTGSCPTEE